MSAQSLSSGLREMASAQWPQALDPAAPAMRRLLAQAIMLESVSGREGEFVRFIEAWARAEGFQTDCWEATEAELSPYPQSCLSHLPLAGRPTLVIRLPGRAAGRSLLFNAHSDVVAAGRPELWQFDPWSGADSGGRIYGRGACDAKGPLVSALWALWAIRSAFGGLAGDVLLELIPGEEDCVGLGTLTSVARGYRADGVIVLEPTECRPYCASRGGCRFEIECLGRAVHGTLKWLGRDAIGMIRLVLEALARLEARWNDRHADPLFAAYPIARPITVDAVQGGQWQGMVCDRCRCAGYLELLPGDAIELWKRRFTDELRAELGGPPFSPDSLKISFSEEYVGHLTPPTDPLCLSAAGAAERFLLPAENPAGSPSSASLGGFNGGCEAGLRASLQGSPTLVWGPGSLAEAHAANEFVDFSDVQRVACMFTDFLLRWSSGDGGP